MKQRIIVFMTGIVAGALLFAGTTAYAAGVMAEHTPQRVMVDGKSIQVDSSSPYTGTGPMGQSINQGADERGLTYNADGYIYEIKDVRRYDNNVFADGPVGPLPAPTCDWSAFPILALPPADVRHFPDQYGDDLFIRNIFETRRMQYTIYNALGKEPSAWRNGKPLASVQLTIDPEDEPFTQAFWPWRSSELEKLVHGRPNSHYYVTAWDYYSNGIFQHTRYCVASL